MDRECNFCGAVSDQTPAVTPTATVAEAASPPTTLAEATRAVSSTGAPPAPLEDGQVDIDTLREFAAIADGRRPVPGEEPITPPSQFAPPIPVQPVPPAAPPAAPAPSAIEQTLALMQRQMEQQAAQHQALIASLQQQRQPQGAVDEDTYRLQAMQRAGMNPSNAEHQLLFDLHKRNSQLEQQVQQMAQFVQGLQQRAQTMTLEQQLASEIDTNTAALRVEIPPAVRADMIARASWYAQQGQREKATELALRPYLALIEKFRPAAPTPPPSTPHLQGAPAFAGQTPEQVQAALHTMNAVTTPGRGAGRLPRSANLADVTKLVSRS